MTRAGRCTPGEVADRLAVADLLAAYADSVTRMAPDELRDLFLPEATWTVTGYGEPSGHDEIVTFLARLLEAWSGIVHVVHHGRVAFDAHDPDAATGWWVITEEGLHGGEHVRFVGVYHDTYRRTADGWRFATRRYDGLLASRPEGTSVRPWPAEARRLATSTSTTPSETLTS